MKRKFLSVALLFLSISCYSNPNYDLSKDQINEIILLFSDEWNVPELLMQELCNKESKYNIYAHSYAGAKGLMQLLPSNHEWFSWKFKFNPKYNYLFSKYNIKNDPSDLYNPIYNIWYGIRYYRWILDTYSESYWVALIIYNSGQKWYINNDQPGKGSINYANEIMRNWHFRRIDR